MNYWRFFLKQFLFLLVAVLIVEKSFSHGEENHKEDSTNVEDVKLPNIVTFAEHIGPLLQSQCMLCHHQGGPAELALKLDTFEDARSSAKFIEKVVVSRKMPHAATRRPDPNCGGVDRYKGIRRLTETEIAMVKKWVLDGTPSGDLKQLPPNPDYKNDPLMLRKPDLLVSQAAEGFIIPGNLGNNPGESKDMFRNFNLPINFQVDRFLVGFKVLPGKSIEPISDKHPFPVIHHAHLFVALDGKESEKLEMDYQNGKLPEVEGAVGQVPYVKGPGYELRNLPFPAEIVGSWFPGGDPFYFPKGVAQKIPKGGKLVLQIHYTLYNESEISDITQVGLFFTHEPVEFNRYALEAVNEDFVIPAGATHHIEKTEVTLDKKSTLISLLPHQHQIGTDYFVNMLKPKENKEECLLNLKWDFSHQTNHVLNSGLKLPAGTKLSTQCVYDNSVNNPLQFNFPPIDIDWGPVANKEMCRIDYFLLHDDEKQITSKPEYFSTYVNGKNFYINGNGFMTGATFEIDNVLYFNTYIDSDGKIARMPIDQFKNIITNKSKVKIAIVNPDGGRTEAVTISNL